jgi:hypothetical protein
MSSPDEHANPMTWAEFLADAAPGEWIPVCKYQRPLDPSQTAQPELEYFCPNCNAFTPCSPTSMPVNVGRHPRAHTLTCLCLKCNTEAKRYFLETLFEGGPFEDGGKGKARKQGEWPLFRPRIPSKVRSLLGDDFDEYQKGMLAESAGLGVGAFGYYRRVLERQRARLFQKIKQVAERKGEVEAAMALEAAIGEKQFTKSLDIAKPAVPKDLFFKGHNPLTLLHDLISNGIHDEEEGSDERSLEAVKDIRLLLGWLAQRMSEVMKDEAEMDAAVSRLAEKRRASKS